MRKFLVIRLSALGDVAISVPLIHALALQYPDCEFTVVSQPRMVDLFSECPLNVKFFASDIYGKHKGIFGLFRLFLELKPKTFDAVCDLHDVFRTNLLCLYFRLINKPVYNIEKQRKAKRLLTRRKDKNLKQLNTSFQQYQSVFEKVGLTLKSFNFNPKLKPSEEYLSIYESIYGKKNEFWLGFAPFAKHAGKIYPLEKSEIILASFAANPNFKLFVFGGGAMEREKINSWKEKYPSIQIPTQLSLIEEIHLMKCLDLMVAMDSANMHLGSLAQIPVVSIWGATHPFAGFYGLFQSKHNAIQQNLTCRPCSVFGNKPCYRGDYACLNSIDPVSIIDHIYKELAYEEAT